MADLFISYAHEDETRIQPLAHALEQQGWSVFWDRHIPAGQTWRSYIGQALIDARCVIVAWSQHSITSRWVAEEADEGQKRGMLVPLLLDSVEPPIGFRSIQAADLTNWQPDRPSARFEQLVRDINASMQNSLTPPATEHTAKPEATTHRQSSELLQRQPKGLSQRLPYALLAVIVVLIVGGSYWGYQKWFSHSADMGATAEALRKFWKPDGVNVNEDNEARIRKWMDDNYVNEPFISYFIIADSYVFARQKLVKELGLGPSSDALSKFWKPDGANINQDNEARIRKWMDDNHVNEPSITSFMRADSYVFARQRLVQELGLD
jgi:hypothetical protein